MFKILQDRVVCTEAATKTWSCRPLLCTAGTLQLLDHGQAVVTDWTVGRALGQQALTNQHVNVQVIQTSP